MKTRAAVAWAVIALGALAGLLVLAALAVFVFVDVDAYKPRVESAASSALGMDVTVEGRMRVGFVPGLHLTLGNVRVRNGGSELAFVEAAELAIELLPLLRQELRYGSIVLNRARISVELGRDGRYNYQKPAGFMAAFRPLDLKRVSFPELVFVYADKASGNGFESGSCKGELTNMRHPGGAPFLVRLSLSGQFACNELRGRQTAVSDVKFSIEATDGVFDFKPVTMRVAGGRGSGSLRMDHSAAVPALQLVYSLSKFRIEEFFKGLPPEKSVSGLMDFSTTLSMRGRTRVELRRSASGQVSLSGMNLTLAGVDLDETFSKYRVTQSFNLFDMTAFLLAGPIGLAVTKGYDYSNLARQAGGSTQIRTVVSQWKVEKGVAHAADVALATRANRLALQGGLDFVNEAYDEVFVALVDSNGCARMRQRIRGPFGKPVLEKPDTLTSLAGPVVGLIDKARALLPGTGARCDVFYSGSVASPR
jgi:AsmA-like protein